MEHQTLYYGDCLDWMRQWDGESADLIYLDPPFNSNATYNILFNTGNGTPTQVLGFKPKPKVSPETWHLHVDRQWQIRVGPTA